MPEEYRHMQECEREIIELYEKGLTLREIGEKFGFTYKQIREFKTIQTYEEVRPLIDEYIHFYNHQRIQLKTKLTPLELRSQYIA